MHFCLACDNKPRWVFSGIQSVFEEDVTVGCPFGVADAILYEDLLVLEENIAPRRWGTQTICSDEPGVGQQIEKMSL